jgi:hypothetical protein
VTDLVSIPSRRCILAAAISIACVLPLAGCNRGPEMYHVKGHVFYKDGTVPAGAVRVVIFQPKKDSPVRRAASASIDPDGSFEMWTKTTGDGVTKGEYDVGFTILKSPHDSTPLIKDEYATPGGAAGSITVDHNIDDLKFVIEPLPGVTGAPPTSGG